MENKVVVFNGETYVRNPKSRYYFKHTTRNCERKNAKQLHRAVWEYYNGTIPEGYHIHHIDGNIDNNDISNLECVQAWEHLSCHAKKILKTVNIGGVIKNSYFHSKKKRKNGTEAQRAENGTSNTHKNQFLKAIFTMLKSSVSIAEKHILRLFNKDFALQVVKGKQDGAGLGLNSSPVKNNAKIVAAHSLHTTLGTSFAVQSANSNIIPVYNLTVEKAGCYYANGILVSNCDSAACICRLFDRRALDSYQSLFGG